MSARVRDRRGFKFRQSLANADEPLATRGELRVLFHALFEKPDNVVTGA